MNKPLGILATALSAAMLLSACGASSGSTASTDTSSPPAAASSSDSSSSPSTEDSPTSESGSSFVDGVLTTPDLKIVIKSNKVIPPGKKGNEYGKKPVLAFWYTITRLGDKEVTPMDWIMIFTAYQDNDPNAENKLDVGMLPDDRFGDSQLAKLKKGGTVENAVSYELDDKVTPVDLVASDDFGMTEIGKATYPVK